MTSAVLALGAASGLGLFLIVWALVVRPDPDEDQSANPAAARLVGGVRRGAQKSRGWKELIRRNLQKKTELVQDALMVGRSLEVHALAKVAGLVLGLVVAVGFGLFMSVVGLTVPTLGLVLLGAVGAGLGWWLPDSMLRTEADKERLYFQQVAESWLELAGQLVTAGSDTFAALVKAASYSDQPVFVTLQEALRVSAARGEPPWTGLRNMADARRLRFLDPFCAALELAGTTGAESRRTILAQVESARSKAMFEADAAAASSSEKMGAPLALIGGAFMVLMGYPPLAGIMDSSTISGMSGL